MLNGKLYVIGGYDLNRNSTSTVNNIQNSGHAPTAASESAIIASLPPDNYTAIIRGVNKTTGVGLVEVYDLESGVTSILGNISTRGFVQTDDTRDDWRFHYSRDRTQKSDRARDWP